MSTASDGLSYLTLDETSPEVVLNGFTSAALQLIYQHEEKTKETASKKTIVNYLASAMRDVAAKAIVSNLSHSELKVLVDAAKISYGERNKPTKVVLKKRLYECLSKNGLQGFFEAIEDQKLRTNAASLLCDAIEIEPQNSLRRTLEALSRELSNIGFQAFFDSYPSSKLHDICVELGLDNPNVHSKPELIKAIVERKAPKRLARRRSEPKFTKKKKPIVRGVTYHDLFQHYQVSELREYCASNLLIKSGKKKVIINRILAYLDGDTETTIAPLHSVKKKRPHAKSTSRSNKKSKPSPGNGDTDGDLADEDGVEQKIVLMLGEYDDEMMVEPIETEVEGASISGSPKYMNTEEEEEEEEQEEEEEDEDDNEKLDETEEEEDNAVAKEFVRDAGSEMESEDFGGSGYFPDNHVQDKVGPDAGIGSTPSSEEEGVDQITPFEPLSMGSPEPEFAEEGATVDRLNELDLDKLDEQPIEVLLEYCQEEGLDVGGKTKEHYIEAILAYNEVEEIDLDKLENHEYSLETLREYCAEEGLAADPHNENDMIAKILAYNDDVGCVPE